MKEPKVYYVTGVIKKEIAIEVLGQPNQLKLEWADGMVGVMPAFNNISDAIKYGGKGCTVVRMFEKEEDIPLCSQCGKPVQDKNSTLCNKCYNAICEY